MPSHRIQVPSRDAACRIVAAGLGIAILPRETGVAPANGGALVMVPLDEPWSRRRFVVISRGPALLSAAARLLGEHLSAQAATEQDATG